MKIRLASKPVACTVERYVAAESAAQAQNGSQAQEAPAFVGQPWLIKFKEPQRAVAPGQSAVVYIDNIIRGGGLISMANRLRVSN